MAVRPVTCLVVGSCMVLAACGTDVKRLLERETRLAWYSENVVMMAEDLESDLEIPVYRAEAEKQDACGPINRAAQGFLYHFGEVDFGQQLWSDLKRLVLALVPLPFVEECTRAHERYNEEVAALHRRLAARGIHLRYPYKTRRAKPAGRP